MKVGQTIYVLREHSTLYRTLEIVGETSRSWLVLTPGHWGTCDPNKYAEKLAKNGNGYKLGSEADAALKKWAVEHSWKISERLRHSNVDAEILLQVAKLLNYEKLPEAKP